MAIIKCGQGHFYDSSKHSSCPHCRDGSAVSVQAPGIAVEALSGGTAVGSAFGGDEKTVSLYRKTRGVDPVTGWLVCVSGKERGRDYRLHTGRNFVGRSYAMQISIPDDDEISRENHCSVVYEPNKGVFLLVAGLGTNTYHNGIRLDSSAELRGGDNITIGSTDLEFVPYCGEGRRWE